jgi:methionine-rich copper-binding protein CopC
MRPFPVRPRPVLALLVGVILTLVLPGIAQAHAEIATATPAADSTVETQPGSLDVTFTEAVDPSKTSIEIRDAGGTVVAKSEAADVSADGVAMSVPLPTLENGAYEVRWTTAALDGHIERGTYTFTVALAPSPFPSPSPSPSPTPVTSPSSPSPSPAASSSPAASGTPVAVPADDASSTSDAGSLILPLAAVVILVVVLGAWFVQRRRA